MIYIKLYEDYSEPLFEELTIDEFRSIHTKSYINFKDYPYRKDLINFIKVKLEGIFNHSEYLTLIEKCYYIDKEYTMFHIIERKNLPFTISLRITDDDYFIVKIIYYCNEATYLCWRCDGLRGFIAFLKYLVSLPKSNFVGKNKLNALYSVEFGTQFTYTTEQLQSLVDKLDIESFKVKLNKIRSDIKGNAYATWELNIKDIYIFYIYYVPSMNCFGVRISKKTLQGKQEYLERTCFTEEGLYSLLEKEYENLIGMYYV
jgi:hypothetical protein